MSVQRYDDEADAGVRRPVRVLVVSNLDSSAPFGAFTRPFYLGRALARAGAEVANVGVDCTRVDFGPAWSVGRQDLRGLLGATRVAVRRFTPDLIYAHQNLPAVAALAAAGRVPVAADFHSLPSVEWSAIAPQHSGAAAARVRLNAAKAFAAERRIARGAASVVAAGAEVAEVLTALHRPARAPFTVGNGVEDRLLDAAPSPAPPALAAPGRHAVATIPAAASAANAHSLDYLRDVARLVAESAPDIRLHVIGSDHGPDAPNLAYHGFQPDFMPWVEHAGACLLPYPYAARLCGGARNKLVEALARGRRVVTTGEGLRGVPDAATWRGVHVAPDDAEGFAAALVRALGPGSATLEAERDTVRAALRWDALGARLHEHLEAVVWRGAG